MVASIGLVTGAGTDCGCCRSAIARILGEATCEGPALQASCPGTARPGDRLGPSGPVEASWAHAGGAYTAVALPSPCAACGAGGPRRGVPGAASRGEEENV